jgi:hypothetical protein
MVRVRKFTLFLVAIAFCLPRGMAWGGPREDAAAAMVRCDAIRDNSVWLECHERATAQMRAARPRGSSRAPKKLVARADDVSFSKSGYFTIELDNGQWWRQIDGDTNYARFRMPANRNIVTIERGALGSYNLHIQGLNQGYKVNRIR